MAELAGVRLPDSVTVAEGEGGLPTLRVSAPGGVGEVYLHGAHVTAWTPSGKAPVIWMSRRSMFEPGQPIRGGVPICFPWFGPGRSGDKSPAHGLARLAAWTLTSAGPAGGTVTVTLRLTDGDVAALPGTELWPHRFDAVYRVTFGPELGLELTVRNTGEEEVHLRGGAAHLPACLRRPQGNGRWSRRGHLRGQDVSGGALVTQEGPVVFAGETDRVYRSPRKRRCATAPAP